jgi:hypothetical protein
LDIGHWFLVGGGITHVLTILLMYFLSGILNDASVRGYEFSIYELRVHSGHMGASCVRCCYLLCSLYCKHAWPNHRVSSGLKLLLTLPYAVFGPEDLRMSFLASSSQAGVGALPSGSSASISSTVDNEYYVRYSGMVG